MLNKKTSHNNLLLEVSAWGVVLLLAIMPFHAAIVTIVGNYVGYKLFLQSWKEIAILSIAVLTIYAYVKDRTIFKLDNINKLALIIIAFSLLLTILIHTDLAGTLAGIKTNIAVLTLFLSAQTLSKYIDKPKLTKLVIYPAFVVAAIAVLQPWILSPALLSRLGYGENSIVIGQYIESSKSVIRVFSTLGGPNQLGTYLIVPFSFCLALGLKKETRLWLVAAVLFCLPIYMTYSRSAWLGVLVATVLIVTLRLNKKAQVVIGSILGLAAIGGVIMFFSINPCGQLKTIQAQFLHGSCVAGTIEGPDAERIKAIQTGLSTVSANPLGYGLGSSGPASFYSSAPRIVENWFLQITIEVGIVGLLMYLVLFGLIFVELYRGSQNNDIISLALFGCLMGVLVTGMFLHSLGDSTLSIILFALLGINRGYVRS